ncbi:MAG: chorismate synthase [Sphaerochaetaceae bacterium]
MSKSTFGSDFAVTTFGESHGAVVGAVIDGIESGFKLDLEQIKVMLDRRRPQDDVFSTPRRESDSFEIQSGVFEGKTTGAPICLVIRNSDSDSSSYEQLRFIARPGHADLPYSIRYANRDHRGGGRSSGRLTAAIVASGAIAIQILNSKGVSISCKVNSIGGIRGSQDNDDDMNAWRELASMHRKRGETLGGRLNCIATGLPIGIGEPVFDKLDAVIAHAVMSIPAVKGIEFGSGFNSETQSGSANNLKGNSGGVLGGLSDGEPLSFNVAIKPVPTVDVPQTGTDTRNMMKVQFTSSQRHDTCICFRACPVVEAMTAVSILDLWYARYGR